MWCIEKRWLGNRLLSLIFNTLVTIRWMDRREQNSRELNDAAGARPSSIKLHLFANGNVIVYTLSEVAGAGLVGLFMRRRLF